MFRVVRSCRVPGWLAPGRCWAAASRLPRLRKASCQHESSDAPVKSDDFGLGTYPAGWSSDLDVAAASRLVDEALDLGINFIDAARIYGRAEDAIGRILGDRRDKIFLTTKVWADDAKEAEDDFEESLRDLRTDYVDLVYVHSIGNRDVKKVMGPEDPWNTCSSKNKRAHAVCWHLGS